MFLASSVSRHASPELCAFTVKRLTRLIIVSAVWSVSVFQYSGFTVFGVGSFDAGEGYVGCVMELALKSCREGVAITC